MEFFVHLQPRQWLFLMMILLKKYNGDNSDSCVPNSAQLQVKAVRASIKNTIIDNPTLKPSVVYSKEVDKVRDELGEGFKEEFDQLMPTQVTLNPSIYAWSGSC